jgi:hypothetical protein
MFFINLPSTYLGTDNNFHTEAAQKIETLARRSLVAGLCVFKHDG